MIDGAFTCLLLFITVLAGLAYMVIVIEAIRRAAAEETRDG